MPSEEILVSEPLGRDLNSEIRIKQTVTPEGKPSQTNFRMLENIGKYAKVEAIPLTGRTHQIRVHAKH